MDSLCIVIAGAALLVACVALALAFKPPQTRYVLGLTAEVQDLQTALLGLVGKVTKRERIENVEQARGVRATNRSQEAALAAEAAALVGRKSNPGGGDTEAHRAELRARFLVDSPRGSKPS